MFGIARMLPTTNQDQKEQFRLHYCGNCKSIGRLYSQKARFFTNFDVTLLSEMLSGLSSNQRENWQESFKSWNCFDLPKTEEVPAHLQYTAGVSVLLADLKFKDNLIDSKWKFSVWHLLKTIFSKDFKKAKSQLAESGVSVNEMWDLFLEQIEREAQPNQLAQPLDAIAFYSEVTAKLTAQVFANGARISGALEEVEVVSQIGFQFGKLAYILDALEDFDKDILNKEFNAVQAAYHISHMSKDIRDELEFQIREIVSHLDTAIRALPLPILLAESFSHRIAKNVERRLLQEEKTYERLSGISWKDKMDAALKRSKAFFESGHTDPSFLQKTRLQLSVAMTFLLFLMLPYRAWARSGSNWADDPGVCIAICCVLSLCGGTSKSYVVEKDACGRTTVRETGPCGC
ncbi:MAG: DUF5685 family protein [Bacteroidota bacterium]